MLVIDDRDTPLTLADERIARAIRENNARLVIIDPVQAFLGADVDMNRANEVRPIFRSLGDIAQATGCAMEGIKVKDTAKRAIVTVIVFVIIYVLSGPIIGYTNYDMYLKGIEFLSAVIGAGCYWIGSNKK